MIKTPCPVCGSKEFDVLEVRRKNGELVPYTRCRQCARRRDAEAKQTPSVPVEQNK